MKLQHVYYGQTSRERHRRLQLVFEHKERHLYLTFLHWKFVLTHVRAAHLVPRFIWSRRRLSETAQRKILNCLLSTKTFEDPYHTNATLGN